MTAVVPLNTRTILGRNQETYQQLRLILGLNLRRQLLLAVCDDAELQQQLANRLAQDLIAGPNLEISSDVGSNPIVTIWLSQREPDLVKQIASWLQQHGRRAPQRGLPTFQVLGIDQLIRQSATRQKQFLLSLTRLEPLLARLDIRLLLWIPRPWLNQIRRSVPMVWRLRSGVFDFVGEPTSADSVLPDLPRAEFPDATPATHRPPAIARKRPPRASQGSRQRPQRPGPSPAPGQSGSSASLPGSSDNIPVAPVIDAAQQKGANPPESQLLPDVWTMLTDDLSALEVIPAEGTSSTSPDRQTGAVKGPEPRPADPPEVDSLEAAAGLGDGLKTDRPDSSEPIPIITSLAGLALGAIAGEGADSENQWEPLEITTLALTSEDADDGATAPIPAVPVTRSASPSSAADAPFPAPVPDLVAQDEQLLACWQQLQALARQQAGPLTLARANLALGQTCRQRIEAGDYRRELLSLAIAAYDQAVPGLKAGTIEWCDALNDLGSLYWLRAQAEPQPEAIAQGLTSSIQTYEQALQTDPDGLDPETLARLYSNLGTVYGLLATLQDAVENLEQAVRAYRHALNYRPAGLAPTEYASLNNSLGAVHWRLAHHGDNRHHLHQAIAAYNEALPYRSPQDSPQEYAMLQNNLGIAYWSLAKHERPVFLLEQAVDAYHAALAFRTLASDPQGYAATQNNLGTAFWDLAQQYSSQPQQQLTLWQQAVNAYENALLAANRLLEQQPRTVLSFDLWATCHSAGVVHDQIAQYLPDDQADQRTLQLQQALQFYLMALNGWQSQPDKLDVLKAALVQNVRLHYQFLGIDGQQQALAQLPAPLLPDILPRL